MEVFMACLSPDGNDAPVEKEKLMLQDKNGIAEELKCLKRWKRTKSRMEKKEFIFDSQGAHHFCCNTGKYGEDGCRYKSTVVRSWRHFIMIASVFPVK